MTTKPQNSNVETANVENVETANVETTTQTAPQNEEQTEIKRDVQNFEAIILPSVFVPNSTDSIRIILNLDTSFVSYDEDGQKVQTNTFGIQVLRLYQLIQHKVLNKVMLLTMGKRNPEINFIMGQIVLCLIMGQKAKIQRTEHFKTERRKETNDLYNQNCYGLDELKIKFDETLIDYEFINDLLMDLKSAVKNSLMPQTSIKQKNPFNI